MERSLTRDEERIEVLDKMVMRLYEDMIAGRISEQNFNTMLEKTVLPHGKGVRFPLTELFKQQIHGILILSLIHI